MVAQQKKYRSVLTGIFSQAGPEPWKAVVEPAVRRREATKARVAPKQVAACGYLPSLLRKLANIFTAILHLYLVVACGYLPSLPFGKLADHRLL